MYNQLNIDDSIKKRGFRLKKIRKIMGLSTEKLAQLLGYSRQTISYWENAIHRGLSKRGANKLIEVVKQYGIECDEKWLLYGIGEIKMSVFSLTEQSNITHWMKKNAEKLRTNIRFFKEIEAFLLNNANAVIAEITDFSMYPLYIPGDWVGGYLIDINDTLSGKICIVEVNQECQVRVIQPGSLEKRYNLYWLHQTEEKNDMFELKNIELTKVAIITQFWSK